CSSFAQCSLRATRAHILWLAFSPPAFFFFFFTLSATPEIYTLSLHDALPISGRGIHRRLPPVLPRRLAAHRAHGGETEGSRPAAAGPVRARHDRAVRRGRTRIRRPRRRRGRRRCVGFGVVRGGGGALV